jgi:cytochrome c biogenesis protein CcmG/thiol:disulfide interchange protein DsbE
MRGMFLDVLRRFLVATLGFLLACAEQAAPTYTRVSGPVPDILTPTRTPATLVVFWATWCPPCREELGPLRTLAQDPPRGLSVVTFGQDESAANVTEFFGGGIPPELGYRPDPDHRAAIAFGVDVLPAAFLVADGQLVARFGGARDWSSREMRRLLEKLARERRAAGARQAPREG